ncbi:MAG: Aerobic cobaltochelatase CobT subunit, partial [uncultured Acetobacteraceae bacterium]
ERQAGPHPPRGIQARHRRRLARGGARQRRGAGGLPARPRRRVRQARAPALADAHPAAGGDGETARRGGRGGLAAPPPFGSGPRRPPARPPRSQGGVRRAGGRARGGGGQPPHARRRGQPPRPPVRLLRVRGLRPHDPQGPVAAARGAVLAGARAHHGRSGAGRGAPGARPVARHLGRQGRRRAGRNGPCHREPGRLRPRRAPPARRARPRRSGGGGRGGGPGGRRGAGREHTAAGPVRRGRSPGAGPGKHARRPARGHAGRGRRRRGRGDRGRGRRRRGRRQARRPAAAPRGAADRRREPLPRLRHAVRRGGGSGGALRPGGVGAAAATARPAALALARRRLEAGQPLATAADGAAATGLGVRPGRGAARRGPPRPRGGQPDALALLQAGAGSGLPGHRRVVADRQLRLHARPADHRRRHVLRHPGPDAGTLRGQDRDPGLHHPSLEGRTVARTLGPGRQAAQPGPAERPAPRGLQVGRHALAAGAQEPRADAARRPAQGEHRRRGAGLGLQAPPRPDGTPAHPHGHLRRRAGGRFHPEREPGQLPGAAPPQGDRRHRGPGRRRADRHRHRPRRDALLPPRRHHRGRRGTGRHHDEEAGRAVRRGRGRSLAPRRCRAGAAGGV